MSNKLHNVIIIGGGCAGLTAALYCARAELSPIVFVGNLEDKGGLLVKTSIVENYPGFSEGILGFDLIQGMETQAIKAGTTIIEKNVVSVKLDNENGIKEVVDSDGVTHFSITVIIATGSTPNKLGLPREDVLWSKGISSCAVCDGALYKKKQIVVVGGGDSAMEEASFLTKFSDVTLIHRGSSFRASKAMQKKVLENPKVKIIMDTVVSQLHGKDKLDSITLKNVKTGKEKKIKVDGLFYGLGLKPNSQLFKDMLDMTEDGYIIQEPVEEYDGNPLNLSTMTTIEGVFVAGDVHDKIYRQAIVACGDGCKAAMDVIKWVELLKELFPDISRYQGNVSASTDSSTTKKEKCICL